MSNFSVTDRSVTFSLVFRPTQRDMEKHAQKRQQIIDTAFKVWGEEFFFKTSLTTLAEAVGSSKTALYRYFKNKDSLIEAMRQDFLRVHTNICLETTKAAEGKNFEERLALFQQKFLRFYAENYWYYRFASLFLLPNTVEGFQQLEEVLQLQNGMFPTAHLQREFEWSEQEVPVVQRFIFSVGTFLLNRGNIKEVQEIRQLTSDELLAINKKLIFEGMRGHTEIQLPDFEAVEKACRLEVEDLLPQEPLFAAISKVVAEEGLWDASLEQIARSAGMSKSSLYFHFNDRNEMLWKMIDNERHQLGTLFLERSRQMESFEERLYAFFAVFAWYLARRPEFLAVMNWFRFQQFHIKIPKHMQGGMDRYIEFLSGGLESGKLRSDIFDLPTIARWVNYGLIQELNNMYWMEGLSEKIWPFIRTTYKLFLFGVEGAEDEKK